TESVSCLLPGRGARPCAPPCCLPVGPLQPAVATAAEDAVAAQALARDDVERLAGEDRQPAAVRRPGRGRIVVVEPGQAAQPAAFRADQPDVPGDAVSPGRSGPGQQEGEAEPVPQWLLGSRAADRREG